MHRTARSLLPLSLALSLSALAAEPPAPAAGSDPLPALLRRLAKAGKAREERGQNRTVVISTVAEDLNKEGEVESRSERVLRRVIREGKVAQGELVRAVRDGKDETEERRKKLRQADKDAGEKSGSYSLRGTPFDEDQQPHYTYELRGSVPGALQQLQVAFKPRQPATERLVGEAVVDTQVGDLLHLQGRPSKLPPFAQKADFVLEFNHVTPTGRDLSRMALNGEGGMLFIHKRVRAVTTFTYEE
jgi:hypothetical protein